MMRLHSRSLGFVWLGTVGLAACSCGTPGIGITTREVPTAGGSQSADPALTIDPVSGDLVMGWVEGDGRTWALYVARSAKAGEWSTPVRVAGGAAQPDEVHPHGESSPRLITGADNHLALVWPNSIKVEGRKWPAAMMRFSGSADGGLTWSRPRTINDDTTGTLVSHQFHGATLAGDSTLVVAWLDER